MDSDQLKEMEANLKAWEAKLMKKNAELEKATKYWSQQKQIIGREQQVLYEEKIKTQAELLAKSLEITHSKTMFKGTIGNINEFSLKDDWILWEERLHQFFKANDIEESKKVPLFLTLMGSETYALLRNVCAPVSPAEKTLEDLCDIMSNHLQPKPSIIAERYKFKECKQGESEEIKQFVANLKKLSINCDFGNNLKDSMRDQLVWGLRSDSIKKRLLGEKNLTYERAVEVAVSLEVANMDAARMGSSPSGSHNNNSGALNFIKSKQQRVSFQGQGQQQQSRNKKTVCYCCGKLNHISSDCRFRNYTCNICKKVGHLQIVCKAKNSEKKVKQKFNKREALNVNKNVESKPNNSKNHNYVSEMNDLKESFDCLFTLNSGEVENMHFVKPFRISIKVENSEISFEVDTGSPITAVSMEELSQRAELKSLKMCKTGRQFKSYKGDLLKPLGVMKVKVEHDKKRYNLELFVFRGNSPPIIGREWLSELKLIYQKKGKMALNFIKSDIVNGDSIYLEFKEVFCDKVGKYTKNKLKLYLKEEEKPVFCKARPIPYAMRELIEREINNLVNEGILVQVESSDWGTPIVPIHKSNGQMRICSDFKVTLNPQLVINKHPIPRVQDLLAKLDGGAVFSKLDMSQAYQQVE